MCGYRLTLLLAIVAATGTFTSSPARADGEFDFYLTSDFLQNLADQKTILYSIDLVPEHRKDSVNKLASDCELHIASKPASTMAWPSGLVIEPPMVCKETRPKLTDADGTTTPQVKSWPKFLDKYVMGKTCNAVGFPRIFTEHAAGTGDSPTNPDHVTELHPLIRIKCDGTSVDMLDFVKYIPGMRAIKATSLESCLTSRKLHVTFNQAKSRYEFTESGGSGCGNFGILNVAIYPQWVREIKDKDGTAVGHSAIARGYSGNASVGPVKIYTFAGRPEDTLLAGIGASDPNVPTDRIYLHGLLTYDYFAILKAIQAGRDAHFAWLRPDEVQGKEVTYPFAFVVFGEVKSVPDKDHEGSDD